MAQPRSERPTIAMTVTNAMARPACCAPMAGTSREKRWAVKPICANNPRAMPANNVRNLRSRQSSSPGNGFAAGDVTEVVGHARKISVGRQAHLLRRPREQTVGKKPYREDHGKADCCRRFRK